MSEESELVLGEIQKEFPSYRIKLKSDSRFMQVLDLLLLVVTFGMAHGFMSRYTSTVGNTTYVPSNWHELPSQSRAIILRHERVHLRQAREYGWLAYAILYLFAPIPFGSARCRASFEREAYEETMRATHEYFGEEHLRRSRDYIVAQFVGAAYGWMWPCRAAVERWFDQTADRIVSKESVS